MTRTDEEDPEPILFQLSVGELRKRLKLAGFRGSVRALDALGEVSDDDFRCAQLRCYANGINEVFVNTHVNCSHHHLTVDVADLVNAYGNGDLDHGWGVQPNGDAETSITTRGDAARAGIPPSEWATNPYRAS